jgi:hypothetical protein
MTTLRHAITTTAPPDLVWAAIAQVGAVHELAAGFVTATELDGDRRVVTFANGVVAHEWVISVDDERRRLAYSITESPAAMTFHHGSFEVVAAGPDATDGSSVVWTADLLPAEVAPVIDEMMAQGLAAMAAELDARASGSSVLAGTPTRD